MILIPADELAAKKAQEAQKENLCPVSDNLKVH
jgi:uncharacterized OsmC-like protein